MSHPTQNRVFI